MTLIVANGAGFPIYLKFVRLANKNDVPAYKLYLFKGKPKNVIKKDADKIIAESVLKNNTEAWKLNNLPDKYSFSWTADFSAVLGVSAKGDTKICRVRILN